MNLDELKTRREKNILLHKQKKKAYYLKKKLQMQETINIVPKKSIDYSKELSMHNAEDFLKKLKTIAKQQKIHVQNREEVIIEQIIQYKGKKKDYYLKNKEKRLEYDKQYRQDKKDDLKKYRKEYYEKNKDKILSKQKLYRAIKKEV